MEEADMLRRSIEARVEAAERVEVDAARARLAAMLAENRRVSVEVVEARAEMQDLYYYLQQKLDDNYDTITGLEKRVIETRVDHERGAQRHAKQLEALKSERVALRGEAKERLIEAKETLGRAQREAALPEGAPEEVFPRGDAADRRAAAAKRADLARQRDAAEAELVATRESWRRERIRRKERLRVSLAADAQREVEATTLSVFGARKNMTIEDRILTAHGSTRAELLASAKRVAALDAEHKRLDATETKLRREVALAEELVGATTRAKKSVAEAPAVVRSEGASPIPKELEEAPPPPPPYAAALEKATKRRDRKAARLSKIAGRLVAALDCAILLLGRAMVDARADARDAEAAGIAGVCGAAARVCDVVLLRNAEPRWPRHMSLLEPAGKLAFVGHLVQCAHAYRAGLRQLLLASALPPTFTTQQQQHNMVHSLSASALVFATDRAQLLVGGDDDDDDISEISAVTETTASTRIKAAAEAPLRAIKRRRLLRHHHHHHHSKAITTTSTKLRRPRHLPVLEEPPLSRRPPPRPVERVRRVRRDSYNNKR